MTETWCDRFLKKSKQKDEKLVEPIDPRIKPGSLMIPRKEISSLEKFSAKSFLSVRPRGGNKTDDDLGEVTAVFF